MLEWSKVVTAASGGFIGAAVFEAGLWCNRIVNRVSWTWGAVPWSVVALLLGTVVGFWLLQAGMVSLYP